MHRAVPSLFLLALSVVGGIGGGGARTAAGGDTAQAGDAARGTGGFVDSPARAAALAPGGTSFRFPVAAKDDPRAVAADHTPPFSLTATDGTGLTLVALDARGVLEPPLAFTELHLTFENPQDRVIEGRFRVALPSGAALSRFAMKIGDAWQEGEVVERQRARQAYEDFLHRRQDPALLEQEAANEFSARVFPIPARGRKEIVVSWSHALVASDEPYVLPLLGLPEVGALDASVLLGERRVTDAGKADVTGADPDAEVSDRRVVELHKQAWTPDRDLVIAQGRVAERAGLRHGNLTVARVAAPVEARPQEVGGLFVLVDSSASRALGYAAQVQRLADLVAGLRDGAGAGTPLAVAAFDQDVAPVFEGTAGDFGDAAVQKLRARRALGASDLAGALGWLDEKLRGAGGRYPRVLLITDGVATAGDVETSSLRAAVRALSARGVERLDALAMGGLRDDAVLRELTTGNLPHDGQRLDGRAPLAELARRLTLACRSGIAVGVEGASWIWPERLDGVQPGDESLVFADLPTERPLRVTLDGRAATLRGELAGAERPLLQRAWAQARIERLLHLRDVAAPGDADLRRALTLQVTQLSVENRVLSPFTALLVLETEWDYARYGLERRSLADVLTVGAAGLEVLARSTPSLRTPPVTAAAAKMARTAEPTQPAALAERENGATASDVETGANADVITVTAESPLLDERRATGAAASVTEVEGLAASSDPWSTLEETPGTVTDRISVGEDEGEVDEPTEGVEHGVVGGVSGGVVGGTPGGTVAGVAPPPPPPAPPPPPSAATAAPEEVPAVEESPARIAGERDAQRDDARGATGKPPYEGRFAEVMAALAARRVSAARTLAERWSDESPGDVLALLALGEAWEAAGDKSGAARAYGSLIDLFPSRADLRRLAGERLERLGEGGLALAVDTYEKAVLQRPDHPSSHRLLAWALVRAGRFADAFAALERGLQQRYPDGRFAGVEQVLHDDLGILGAAWLHAEPSRRAEVLDRLRLAGARIDEEPSLRFVLSWETDANDVDLHVFDRRGGHAYYQAKELASGGSLYADVTTGYGPECFAVEKPGGAPYRLKVHYYSRGPMGYGMGTVQVVAHDGRGGLRLEPRPFVVMVDQAMVDLGAVEVAKAVRAGK
jgi:tetratricopeptide (TPR) repeat protein